jgi:hypothetical protein
MKLNFMTLAIAFVFTACSGSADNKVPELANEMCDCFTKFQQDLSPEGRDLMKAVSTSATPQAELTAGMSKLKPEDIISFAEKLRSIGEKGSAVFTCMQEFDKRHEKETTKDRTALTEKLLTEMKAQGDCPVGAAIVNLSLVKTKGK